MATQQESFSRLWEGYKTDKEAKQARASAAKKARRAGFEVKLWTLQNQLKKYDRLGQPNGRSCNVYIMEAFKPEQIEGIL